MAVVVSAKASGLSQSSRPRQRPAGQRPAALRNGPATVPTEAPAQSEGTRVASIETSVPAPAPAPVVSSRDVDPSTVKPGTRVVQLGAFGSESVARSEWDRLEGRFRAYMVGKGRMIQKANSGGRDFWRLRVVGFDDSSDARRFCAELLADHHIGDFRVVASHQESLHSHDAVSVLTEGPTFVSPSLDPRLFTTLFHVGSVSYTHLTLPTILRV